MTDDDIHSTGSYAAKEAVAALERDRKRQKVATTISITSLCLAVLIAVAALVVVVFDQRGELSDFRAADAKGDELVECRAALASRVTEAQGAFLAASVGDGFVTILRSIGGQSLDVNATADEVDVRRAEYVAAVAARVKYERDGAPLPCPIDVRPD